MFNNKDKKSNKAILFYAIISILGGMVGAFIINLYFARLAALDYLSFAEPSAWLSGNNIFNVPRKITVAQDDNYDEVLNSVKYSVVDIYKKDEKTNNKDSKEMTVFKDSLFPENFIGNGVVLTNDGWILSYGLEGSLKKDDVKNKNNSYVAVFSGNGKETYVSAEVIKDVYSNLSFLKIDARGLSVLSLAREENIKDAQTVLLAGRESQASVENINDNQYSIFKNKEDYIKSSDVLNNWMLISQNSGKDYASAPIINLSGELTGIMAKENTAIRINTIESAFKRMLKNKEILRPSLGIEYIDLSKILGHSPYDKKGALVHRVVLKSSAAAAGIMAGDIILKIEKEDIKNNNLSELIQEYDKGISVNFTILRDKKEIILPVVLK